MSFMWSRDTIRELIARAEAQGEARAKLSDPAQARLFRFAVYSFRRVTNIGYGLIAQIDDSDVVLRRRPEVTLVDDENFGEE